MFLCLQNIQTYSAYERQVVALLVASVWLVHGLYNKLLHGSARHLAIVQSVPGLAARRGEHALIAVARVRGRDRAVGAVGMAAAPARSRPDHRAARR